MNNNYLYIALAIIVFYMLYINFNKTENFTEEESMFATKILDLFKKENKPSFIEYLEKLNEVNNTYDNLISKSVYNKFLSNKMLTQDDILNEMK